MHRRSFHTLIALVTVLVSITGVGFAQEGGDPAEEPGGGRGAPRVLVKMESGGGARSLSSVGEALGHGWYAVPVPEGHHPGPWAADLTELPGVDLAEVELAFQSLATVPFVPNDPLYVSGASNPNAQWHLHVLDLLDAWSTTVGASALVAVLDTGVSPGSDGFCHPFVAEYNAVTGLGGPGSVPDDNGHGTHVSGSVAQCSGNGIGGAGVATDARIMPVDVFDGDSAFTADIVRGMDHAVANGAEVINLSLGLQGVSSDMLSEAIERAVAAGVMVVAATGNDGGPVFYPANHPSVIGVGATTISNGVASYSSGGIGLDVVAPGGSSDGLVWQEIEDGYAGTSGTSMASAHVSGVLALLRARYPQASVAQVRNAISCSTLDLGAPGWDSVSGYGLVQAGDAVAALGSMVATGALTCGDQAAGSSKVAAVQVSTGIWKMYLGTTQIASFFYGSPGDLPFMGDWDCDGVETPGLYRQSDGFVYLRNSNSQGFADVSYYFGIAGDIPVAGDFDGDGCDTVSIYRPSQARFHIINRLGSDNSGPVADYSFLFGTSGDIPFMGDWNGDGVDTPGLRRPSNGFVYLRNSNTQGFSEIDFFYGVGGDVVFSGDWDADGIDSIGLYRPSNGNIYLRNSLSTGNADLVIAVGPGMRPAAGDF